MKKLLVIILVAFIIVSILTIMFTFQASSTFNNFTDDDGDNGDDHVNLGTLNINQGYQVNSIEDSYIYDREQYILKIYRFKLFNAFFLIQGDLTIRDIIHTAEFRFL